MNECSTWNIPPAQATRSIALRRDPHTHQPTHDPRRHVGDAETVAKLASHFPGIPGDRGSGPRTVTPKGVTLTVKFNHRSGEAARLRVAHVTPDYATWWWRDNTPYTGGRQVERKDEFRRPLKGLAAKNKVGLK